MKAIAAASGFQIDERDRQIVTAKKPGENPRGFGFPFTIAIDAPRGKTGRDGCRGLQGLLVEWLRRLAPLTESGRADRPELALRRGLSSHKPAQRLKADIDITRCLACNAGHNQRLGQASVIVGQPVLEPDPVVSCHRVEYQDQLISKHSTQAGRADIVWNRRAVSVKPEQNKGPCAR